MKNINLKKFNQLCEEVSTYLDSENKLKKGEQDSSDSTTNTSDNNVETECCECGAGIDVGSVMGPGTPETSTAELATKTTPVNPVHEKSARNKYKRCKRNVCSCNSI